VHMSYNRVGVAIRIFCNTKEGLLCMGKTSFHESLYYLKRKVNYASGGCFLLETPPIERLMAKQGQAKQGRIRTAIGLIARYLGKI